MNDKKIAVPGARVSRTRDTQAWAKAVLDGQRNELALVVRTLKELQSRPNTSDGLKEGMTAFSNWLNNLKAAAETEQPMEAMDVKERLAKPFMLAIEQLSPSPEVRGLPSEGGEDSVVGKFHWALVGLLRSVKTLSTAVEQHDSGKPSSHPLPR